MATPPRTPTATRPTRWARPSTAIEADTVLIEAMGHDLASAYVSLRRADLDAFEASGESWDPAFISQWELDRYLPYY